VTCFRSMDGLLAHPPAERARRALVGIAQQPTRGSGVIIHTHNRTIRIPL
jgi:hypothetical protein